MMEIMGHSSLSEPKRLTIKLLGKERQYIYEYTVYGCIYDPEREMKLMENNEPFMLKRTGVRWAILMCLCHVIRDAKINPPPPRSVDNKLQVVRCIIETGCREICEAGRCLDDVENILIEKAKYGRIENVNNWIRLLKKTKKDFPDRRELMEIPFMRVVNQNYEFLSYCIP